MDFLVGTFNTHTIYTLHFNPKDDTLRILYASAAPGLHSWLSLSPDKRFLYATIWTSPAAVAAFRITPNHTLQHLNSRPVRRTSGYVAASSTHLYSAGGPSGEVFRLNTDGSIGAPVQELSFKDSEASGTKDRSSDQHGDFGGLRHGAHSIDLSPDGLALYVADIGRNCIWTYSVRPLTNDVNSLDPPLTFGTKAVALRGNDGPRHTTPHPNGRVLYVVQEHSNMLDVFSVGPGGTELDHVSAWPILPSEKEVEDFWADEVRVGKAGERPRHVYASTRGLQQKTRGWVTVWSLDENGMVVEGKGLGGCLDRWETPTSGGIANAIEPAPGPFGRGDGLEYLALTDSQEGFVFVLKFDGKNIQEVARTKLKDEDDECLVVKAATAVWL